MEIAYPYGELTRKHGFATAEPFDAKTGIMSGVKRAREMEILHQRFQAELVAVRGLLRKGAAVRLPSAPRVKESRPGLLAEEPPAKKRKASPPVPVPAPVPVKAPPAKKRKASPPPVPLLKSKKPPTKKMTGSEREMLAEDLETFVAEIPDHIVELLKKQSCATRPGEIEIDLHALDDAAVFELQEQVDKFAREKRAACPSPQERHQDGSKVMAEEEEDDEEVGICGGVSPLAIVPAPPLQLVEHEATSGSPSSRSGDSSGSDSDSDEDEEVDICGGVSPLAILPAPLPPLVGEETNSGSPGSSNSDDSDTDDSSSSDSDDSEHSGSSNDSDSDSDEIVDSPAPAISPPTCEQLARALERQRKEATSRAREKARQEVLHTERTAMPDDTLHREDVKRLGIDEYNTAKPNNLLRQIGLYLKVDDDDDHWKQQHRQNFHEDLEEGEIRQ